MKKLIIKSNEWYKKLPVVKKLLFTILIFPFGYLVSLYAIHLYQANEISSTSMFSVNGIYSCMCLILVIWKLLGDHMNNN